MHKFQSFAASLFIDTQSERLATWVVEQLPQARRPTGLRVEVRERFGVAELTLCSSRLWKLAEAGKVLARVARLTEIFVGPWRIQEARLRDARTKSVGTLFESQKRMTLAEAVVRAQGRTPAIAIAIRPEVDEAEALRYLHSLGQLFGTEITVNGPTLDVTFGDDASQATYRRDEFQLVVASDSIAALRECCRVFEVPKVLGESLWLGTRIPAGFVDATSVGRDLPSPYCGFDAIRLDRFLAEWAEHERRRS